MEHKTFEQYKAEIEEWDWDWIKQDALHNVEEDEEGQKVGMSFLGTVFALAPSGKYYMPWTTNQTDEDEEEDQKFYEALEEVADEHGMWTEGGEGDPCDLFASIVVEEEANERNDVRKS